MKGEWGRKRNVAAIVVLSLGDSFVFVWFGF